MESSPICLLLLYSQSKSRMASGVPAVNASLNNCALVSLILLPIVLLCVGKKCQLSIVHDSVLTILGVYHAD